MRYLIILLAVLMVGCASVEPYELATTSAICNNDCVPEDATSITYGGKCANAEDSVIIIDGINVREECWPEEIELSGAAEEIDLSVTATLEPPEIKAEGYGAITEYGPISPPETRFKPLCEQHDSTQDVIFNPADWKIVEVEECVMDEICENNVLEVKQIFNDCLERGYSICYPPPFYSCEKCQTHYEFKRKESK